MAVAMAVAMEQAAGVQHHLLACPISTATRCPTSQVHRQAQATGTPKALDPAIKAEGVIISRIEDTWVLNRLTRSKETTFE